MPGPGGGGFQDPGGGMGGGFMPGPPGGPGGIPPGGGTGGGGTLPEKNYANKHDIKIHLIVCIKNVNCL